MASTENVPPSQTTVVDDVDALASDPLYQLSTAGQELFHTNMLFSLFTTTPWATQPLADLFGILAPDPDNEIVTIKREWKNLDLFIDGGVGQGKLVLENKLHALPRRDQLDDYYQALPDGLQTDETCYALLSLIPPTFALPQPWRHIDYQDIIEPLNKSATILRDDPDPQYAFHAELLAHYATLVTRLVAVRDRYSVHSGHLQRVKLGAVERNRLQDARLLPLVEKLRIAGLAALITEHTSRPVEIGLSNTHGLAQCSAKGRVSGHHFSWQYQSGQIRLAVALDQTAGPTWRGRRTDRERLVEQYFQDFFDFTNAAVEPDMHSVLDEYTGNMIWLGYEPDFVYKYRPLRTDATYQQLASICAGLTHHIEQYATTH